MPPRTATAASEVDQRTIQILADAAGVQDIAINLGSETSIATHDGTTVTGVVTVCMVLADTTSQGKALLGADTIHQAEVHEWASFRHTHLTPLTDDGLRTLNERLASRTYVAGDQLSLADIVLYAATDAAVHGFPGAQTQHFANLLRWWDYIAHTVDTKQRCPPLQLQPTVFVAPPPPTPKPAAAAPPPAAAAAAATTRPSNTPAAGKSKDTPPTPPNKENTTPPPADAPAGKKASKQQKPESKPAAEKADVAVDMLDIRVGTIVEVGKHPNADALYLEKIDLGEDAPRQVVSGLVHFVPLEAMQGRRVLVVCNLKPAKMRDVMSYGMVLCASNEAHDAVDPVIIPEGVPNGERVTFAGYDREPEAQINPRKKIFEQIAPDLKTNSEGVVVYKDTPCMTSKGPVTATIANASVA